MASSRCASAAAREPRAYLSCASEKRREPQRHREYREEKTGAREPHWLLLSVLSVSLWLALPRSTAMNELVIVTREGDVGVLTINNPPVNALSPGVPEGIIAGVE